MLQLVNVRKDYESPDGNNLCVLKNINLTVEKSQCIAVVGPSGSGKSTLLNIIGALDRPTSGRVLFNNRNLSELTDTELAKIRNRQIGFVFQLHHLLPQCTVLENVLVPTLADNDRASKKKTESRALELLERVGLKDFCMYRPGQLSGGQRQRTAVVRALINEPSLLLADEPTGSLDTAASQKIADLLVKLNQTDKVTLLVVTHSLILAQRMETVLKLDNGVLKDRTSSV